MTYQNAIFSAQMAMKALSSLMRQDVTLTNDLEIDGIGGRLAVRLLSSRCH